MLYEALFKHRYFFEFTEDYIYYLLKNRDEIKTLARVAEIDSSMESAASVIEGLVLRAMDIQRDKVDNSKISDVTADTALRYEKVRQRQNNDVASARTVSTFINGEMIKLELMIDSLDDKHRFVVKRRYFDRMPVLKIVEKDKHKAESIRRWVREAVKQIATIYDGGVSETTFRSVVEEGQDE